MKKIAVLCVLLACAVGMGIIALAEVAEVMVEPTVISEIGLKTVFPAGWMVVTPETVANHFSHFDEETPEIAVQNMRTEGVYAQAFSPTGEAVLRVIAEEGDETMQLYYDIERYTSAMRSEISGNFLDKEAWELTGYRYTAADWTNKEGKGRILNLTYSIKYGEETVARGLQAYTIRDGKAFTLDLKVKGRKPDSDEEKIFRAFVQDTVFPVSNDEPLLPVGLKFTSVVPEETHKAEISVRGETQKNAVVTAFVLPTEGEAMVNIGQIKAGSGGVFKLDMVLPEQGEWRLYIKSELEGYATDEEAFWVSYDAKQLPVTFSSYPSGDVYDSKIVISGKTISGVSIQCMEGETNKKKTTGSDGSFSFTLDRTQTGQRTVVLSFDKKGFNNRRFDVTFNRLWALEDYANYLDGLVQSLSHDRLCETPEKYIGRLVKYKGQVLNLSSIGTRVYVQLGMKPDKEGKYTERIIAVADDMSVTLNEGDTASLYIEVTGEFYAFPDVTSEGDETEIDLPSVKLLTYKKEG